MYVSGLNRLLVPQYQRSTYGQGEGGPGLVAGHQKGASYRGQGAIGQPRLGVCKGKSCHPGYHDVSKGAYFGNRKLYVASWCTFEARHSIVKVNTKQQQLQ